MGEHAYYDAWLSYIYIAYHGIASSTTLIFAGVPTHAYSISASISCQRVWLQVNIPTGLLTKAQQK